MSKNYLRFSVGLEETLDLRKSALQTYNYTRRAKIIAYNKLIISTKYTYIYTRVARKNLKISTIQQGGDYEIHNSLMWQLWERMNSATADRLTRSSVMEFLVPFKKLSKAKSYIGYF